MALCCRCMDIASYRLDTLAADIRKMMNYATADFGLYGFPVFSTEVKMLGEELIKADYGQGYKCANRSPQLIEAISEFKRLVVLKGAFMGVNTAPIVAEFNAAIIQINSCCFEYMRLDTVILKYLQVVDNVLTPFYLLRTGFSSYFYRP